MSRKLPNYLRSHRKRLRLSQDRVAFLLGSAGKDGTTTSRFENFARVPSLETVLALEAIYQKPVSELFAGLFQEIQRDICQRGQLLADRDAGRKGSCAARQRKTVLQIIAANSHDSE